MSVNRRGLVVYHLLEFLVFIGVALLVGRVASNEGELTNTDKTLGLLVVVVLFVVLIARVFANRLLDGSEDPAATEYASNGTHPVVLVIGIVLTLVLLTLFLWPSLFY